MLISMVVSMYLDPSHGRLIGPLKSTQIVENGVLIKGSFPIGAFGTVPLVESESYNWNNVLVGQQMSPWRHAPVRRLTWTSHDQRRVTAGRPYKAINSTQVST